MRRRHAHSALMIATLLLSPALIGASCDPVDLGGDPDAGPSGEDAGPTSVDAGPGVTDAGSPRTDAGPPTGDAGTPGAPSVYGNPVLIDVFDGVESYLSFDFEVSVPAPMGAPARDVRPARLELLASDDTVLMTFPLDPTPLTMSYDDVRSEQEYRAFLTATVADVPPFLATLCASDTYPGRLHHPGYRVVATVDGAEIATLHRWPPGAGAFPPGRPMVLCHQGVRIERNYDGFWNGFMGLFRRPDGLFDAELWESAGGATYTPTSPIRSVDPDVRLSPRDAMLWPSHYPTFTVPMDHFPCSAGDCGIDGLMIRNIDGAASAPMRIPSSTMPYWCGEPAPGAPSEFGAETWPPSGASTNPWSCSMEGTGTDGGGFVRFSGTSDAGPVHIELFMTGAVWYFGESTLP